MLAMRVRDELGEVFADGAFIDAFGIRGKPGISPGQPAMVTVLQFAENLIDRQAADAVRGRIDWKYCLGLDLTDPGFDSVCSRSSGPGWSPTTCRGRPTPSAGTAAATTPGIIWGGRLCRARTLRTRCRSGRRCPAPSAA